MFYRRQHHYKFIASHYSKEQSSGGSDQQASSHSMLGVHASAQAIIHFGKIARKHNLTSVCVESLSKIYTIASVPIVDCFQKIRQQVKCYVQTGESQCGNFSISLSFRFYVKSILENVDVLKLPFSQF